MTNKLENLSWKPAWVSHLGCIKGCLDYLKVDISDAWLFGGTGHAFIINIHEVICPSGPTAWNTEMLFKLGKNLGYRINGVCALKSNHDFVEKRKFAWEHTKRALDKGLPCYGWELDIPEYYVVYGYDDTGYYFSGPGCDSGKGPKPWQELGESKIGVLEMFWVKPGQAADDIKTVKEAFELVLEHSRNPSKWIFPKYKSGLAGYDNWIHALENGDANGFGMAYNAAVWSECRTHAVQFLKEVKPRINGQLSSLFDEALSHYETVARKLKNVSETFPFPPKGDEVEDSDRCNKGLKDLRAAQQAEKLGLETLEKIRSEL